MNAVRTQPRSQPRRSPSPSHGGDGSSTGGFGAPALQMAERTTQPVLGAYYDAGPALSLGGNGLSHGANGQGSASSAAGNDSSAAGGVQFKLTVDSRSGADRMPAVQLCPCEEEHAGTIEPPRVQRQDEKEESEADTDPTQLVQLWDCSEYEEPTCVQTQEVPQAMPVQSKCAECEAEEQVQSKCAECEAEEQVQSKCAECEAEEQVQQAGMQAGSHNQIQSQARRGLQGASHPLPHADRIQAAFGRHDVSQVRASVGGNAEAANRRMGALAFTSGNRIGFREAPSLRLASHEAAHVVQQREGLSLPGNVGRPGDRWERHADRVAAAVVGGRSAEGVLDEVATPEAPAENHAENHAEGGGDSAQAASAPAVQQQITARAARVFEPAVVPETSTAEEAVETPEAAPAETEPGESSEGGSALEAAEEGESEAPPEGVTTEGGASAGVSEPTGEAGAGGEEAGAQGGGIAAPCYNAESEPPPDNAQEPRSDERSTQSEEESAVTFPAWPDEADECPAERAVAEGGQQMPEGLGTGEAAVPVGELASAESVSTGAAPQSGAPVGEGGSASGSREVQAMSRTADEGADQLASTASSMDGQIASAEGERDTAVSDYLTATGGLGSLVARSQSLAAGVSFPAATGAPQAEARQAAIAQARDFIARAADQIADAVAFAQDQLPSMLGEVAESTKATIQDTIETEKVAISERIAQTRAQARAGAAAARAHVNAEYTNSATQIEASTLAAITALDDTHANSLDLVDEMETDGLDDVNGRFATGRTDHEAKGPEYADRAIARGQEHADEYERCKGDYSDDGFWDGCLRVRRAKAQQDAACKTAASFKDGFLRKANKKGHDLIALRRQYRCAVIAGARQVNRTLDDTHAQLVSGLEAGRMQALDSIALARHENLAAIDTALAATLRSLAAQEYTQRQAVNDTGYLKQLAVEQLAHASAASLAQGISAAMDSLEATLAALLAGFAQGAVPDPALLAKSLAVTEASLGGGMGMLLGAMNEGAGQAQARIAEMGSAALEALSLISAQNDELSAQAESGFAGQMGNLRVGAANAFSQLTENHVQQAEQAMTEGTSSMEQAVAGFDDALSTIGVRVDEAIATSLRELDQDLSRDLAKLDGRIASEAWKAAKKEQPAWKSVVAIVLVILVIIAAAVISIVTLGAGASLFAVILVGALVGAVSGGLIQIINNWASGEAWHAGLAQAMIMGAIGGAIGGGLGFAGGALSAGAAQAGARAVTQLAITVGADLVSEGITQTIGYVAFGQEFNWQGFVMAGAMSGVSFRAHPTAHPGMPRPEVPTSGAAGVAASRRAAVAQVAGGAAVGLGVEAVTSAISGENFDLTKAASAAASGAVGARMSRRGAPAGPVPEPTTRLGRAAERFRSFDPGGVGARLESRLQGVGGRALGSRPDVDLPGGGRPQGEEIVSRPRTTAEEAPSRLPEAEDRVSAPRRPVDEAATSSRAGIESPGTGRLRDTLGWSGTPTATPRPGETHLAVIQRGLDMADRIHPSIRGKLGELLPRIEDPLPTQRARLEEVSAELQRLYSDPEVRKLQSMPREVVEQRMGQAAAARRDELLPRLDALDAEGMRLHNEIETARAHLEEQALTEMRTLRQRLIGRNRRAEEMAKKVGIDESAVTALMAQGRTRAAAVRDIEEFYGLAGSRGSSPESTRIVSGGGRAETDPSGRVDIGKEASRRSIFHELAHHIEFRDPSTARAAKSLVEARARYAGRPGEVVPLQELAPSANYKPHEQAMVGDFIDPYTGKVYPDMMTEVVTTGIERFNTPEQMLNLYRGDPEHFFFTLGAILR